MKKTFVLCFFCNFISAADQDIEPHPTLDDHTFIAMQAIASQYFDVVRQLNTELAKPAAQGVKEIAQYVDNYYVSDNRTSDIIPHHEYHVTNGLLYDIKKGQLTCALGTWDFSSCRMAKCKKVSSQYIPQEPTCWDIIDKRMLQNIATSVVSAHDKPSLVAVLSITVGKQKIIIPEPEFEENDDVLIVSDYQPPPWYTATWNYTWASTQAIAKRCSTLLQKNQNADTKSIDTELNPETEDHGAASDSVHGLDEYTRRSDESQNKNRPALPYNQNYWRQKTTAYHAGKLTLEKLTNS